MSWYSLIVIWLVLSAVATVLRWFMVVRYDRRDLLTSEARRIAVEGFVFGWAVMLVTLLWYLLTKKGSTVFWEKGDR